MATIDKTEKEDLLFRYGELMEWLARINEVFPELQRMQAELQKMQSEINKLQKQAKKELEVMVEAAEKHSKVAADCCVKVEAAAKQVESQEQTIKQGFSLINEAMKANSNGNDKRDVAKEQVKESEVEIKELESIDSKIRLIIDEDAGKLQLHFRPAGISMPYRASMKDNGFKYYRSEYCWTADINTTNYSFAKDLIEQYSEKN